VVGLDAVKRYGLRRKGTKRKVVACMAILGAVVVRDRKRKEQELKRVE